MSSTESSPFLLVQEAVELMLARQRLERRARDCGRYLSMLAHDLRTPLTVIRSSAQLLELQPAAEAERAQFSNRLKTIARMVERTDGMIQGFLDLEGAVFGRHLIIRPQSMDLAKAIPEVVNDLRLVHGDRFVLRYSPALADLRGSWDGEWLRRMLENLLNNAVKHGSLDSPIQLDVERLARGIRLSVRNRGPVIPRRLRARLFEPFHRRACARSGKGWGLGLALVRAIVEAHRGSIQVTSSSRYGTRFAVTLPLD